MSVKVPEQRSSEHPRPWTNEEFLRELYWGQMMSAEAISERWNCSATTISTWLDKHGIEKRSRSQAVSAAKGTYYELPMRTRYDGYEHWYYNRETILVHRLLAVAEFGFDTVEDSTVHHKNGIQWDNRPENLEVYGSHAEHMSQHKKVPPLDRERIAKMYEHGEWSSRQLAEHLRDHWRHDVESTTVLAIHKEYFGDSDE